METTENELISVLMPVYNIEPYVSKAIESILNQTYSNIEFIIVDDCSTDKTYSICERYAKKDFRIKLFKNDRNLRIEKTLNFALSKAHGKYIVRMDGDDISALDRFERMKKFLDENKNIILCGVNTITIDACGNELGKSVFPSNQEFITKNLTLRTPVLHIWMTYKKLYDELNGYRVFCGSEDYDFVLRAITSGYKVTNIPDYFGYSVRVNRPNNTTSIYGLQRILSRKYVIKLYKERIKHGKDSYSEENMQNYTNVNPFENKLFLYSDKHLHKAMNCKKERRFFRMVGHFLLSLISPYQIEYYYRRFIFHSIMNKYSKS